MAHGHGNGDHMGPVDSPGPRGMIQCDPRYVVAPPRISCAFKYLDYANLVRCGVVTSEGHAAIEGRALSKWELEAEAAALQTLRAYMMGEITAEPAPIPEEYTELAVKELTEDDLRRLFGPPGGLPSQKPPDYPFFQGPPSGPEGVSP